jgi:helicase
MRVIRCTGDYLDQTSQLIRGKYDVALLTYEMFLNLTVSLPSILNQLGLVVIDEAQFITDPNRGIIVELLLSLLIMARKRGINPQLLTLSAVIGSVNDFDTWLGIQTLITHKRPVPLEEGVMDRTGSFRYIDASGKVGIRQLLPPGAVTMRRDKEEMQDLIVPLVKSLINLGEKIIIFRNQKGSAEGAAGYLSKELGLSSASEAISELPNHDLSSTSMKLRNCLEGGTAFHNANLGRAERLVVERHFRNPKSLVKVLVATTTVAAGINTPASTVILAESEFKGEDGRPFTVSEYKNMVGRAGRLGFNEEGKGILLAQTSYERDRLFRDYVSGTLEAIHSSFNSDNLGSWFIKLLAQVQKVPKENIVGLLTETYGGFLQAKKDPGWKMRMASESEQLISRLATNNLIEYEGENVQLTLLGQVCGRSALSLDSTLRIVDWLGKIPSGQLTAAKLMALVQGLAETDRIYTPMVKRGRSEAGWPSLVYPIYGQDIVGCLQRNVNDQMTYFARCKRAAILWDWINGQSIEAIENKYSKNLYFSRIEYGNIIGIADATRFYLRPAYEIAAILIIQNGISEESIEQILKQLEVGLPADALGLLSLPIPLNRGEYLELFQTGINNPNELWLLDDDNIQNILGKERRKSLGFYRP